jgi:hypothetical protein
LEYVTGLVRRHRKSVGSKGRALPPGKQALMTLAYLKKGETFAQLAAGFDVGTTTAWRYVNETVTLLSARSPKLGKALAKSKKDELGYLVLDGTLIPIDRVRADRPFYSISVDGQTVVVQQPRIGAFASCMQSYTPPK